MESYYFPDATSIFPFIVPDAITTMTAIPSNPLAQAHRLPHPGLRGTRRGLVLAMAGLLSWAGGLLQANEAEQADAAARRLTEPLEKKDFVFRAESWLKELRPEVGKAIKVQLFKGNEYRFCIAVPPQSGIQITAAVLDFEGKPGGDLSIVEGGWGLVLEYKPKRTGVYAVAIRQTEQGQRVPTMASMLVGYK